MENYRSLYQNKESGEVVRARRIHASEYVLLFDSGEKERISIGNLRKSYKFIKTTRHRHQEFGRNV